MCLPTQVVVVFVPIRWSIRLCVTSVTMNLQVKKNLHIQSCMLSDHRVMQLSPMAQLRLLYVCSNQKSRWALTDRRCHWIESVQSVRCACFAVTAGWHRSCGWSLENHMISFCRSSGGSRVWWNHSFISTAHLLQCDKYLNLRATHFSQN